APQGDNPPVWESIPAPKTEGFSPESLLEARLGEELAAAEEQDQDLGLLVILVSGVAGGSESEEKIKEALFARFKDRDYIFQYKSQGAAVITPGASIEEALEQAEDLYAAFRKTARITEGMAIGISTRTGRVIPAARLISEADEAARRAEQNSETPIVALRINPEKYREYLGSAK
ncbi:MAG: hypothetical protein LBR23_07765, partial [Spirochaetaceae bacterium]|nr:hypothetical protein [Spirochaetaceae bacterium]